MQIDDTDTAEDEFGDGLRKVKKKYKKVLKITFLKLLKVKYHYIYTVAKWPRRKRSMFVRPVYFNL